MAANLTNYEENRLMGLSLSTGTLYVGLSTSDPGETGSLAGEPGSGSYARVSAAFTTTGDSATNDSNLVFPTATGSWGTITHIFIIDSASGAGNVRWYGPLTASQAIATGNIFQINAGEIDATLS